MKTVQISVNEDLLKKIDEYAKENFLSRSAFFSMLANNHFQALEVTKSLKDITLSVRKVAENNEIDEETARKLEDFERLARVLNFKT